MVGSWRWQNTKKTHLIGQLGRDLFECEGDHKMSNLCDKTAVAVSPTTIESVAESIVKVFATTVAEDGTTESIPKPKAATATSAMRLKFVFVDICFLSLVVTRNFLVAASR